MDLCERLRPLIVQYSDWDTNIMLAISKSEASCNTNAVGDGHLTFNKGAYGMSCGVLQVRILPDRNTTCDELKDPFKGVEWAHKIWLQQGYKAWSDYKNGKYLKYL